jgi:hypothetical protein
MLVYRLLMVSAAKAKAEHQDRVYPFGMHDMTAGEVWPALDYLRLQQAQVKPELATEGAQQLITELMLAHHSRLVVIRSQNLQLAVR